MTKIAQILSELRIEINKTKDGKITSWKKEGDWKKITTKKNSDNTIQKPESRVRALARINRKDEIGEAENIITEAIRAPDFDKATQLIRRYLQGKLQKVYIYPAPEVFHPANGKRGVGIKFFVQGHQAVRLNWLGNNAGNSNGLISMDFWDGSKSPQPYPSHHVKFDIEQSLVKVLPFIVDFVSGKIDRDGAGIFVNEEVSIYDRPLVTDFNDAHLIHEATYTSGDLHKTVSNILNALNQGFSISDQNKAGGVKKYGPRWNKAIEAIKRNHGDLFTKDGLKHIISKSDVKKIDADKVLAYISGGTDTIGFAVSSGDKETTEVDGASDQDIELMSYEESLDALKTGMKLLMSNASNSLWVAGRGGTGKTVTVEAMLNDAGKSDGDGYFKITGSATPAGIYRMMFEHKNEILLFDDSDSALNDQEGRNLFKAAADTNKRRKISWMKGGKNYVDPSDYDEESDDDSLPRYFDFTGKIIFISNMPLNKLDPDGALRTRGFIINVDPTNEEIYDFMAKICDKITLDVNYPINKNARVEVINILRARKVQNKTANLRQLVRGLNTRAGIESQGGTDEEWQKFVRLFA